MFHSSPAVVLPRTISSKKPQQDGPPGFWTAAALTHPGSEPGWLRKRLKFAARAWLTPQLSRAWLRCVTRPDIAPLWKLRPRLAAKLQRPYQCASWSPRQRWEALQSHYALFPQLVNASIREEIYGRGCTLLRIRHVDSRRELQVRLFYRDQFEKEGELTLGVFDQTADTMLAGVTFSLHQKSDTKTALIGGLQAGAGPQTRALIHDVAKEMHGMRPKAFALWALQRLLTGWGIQKLCAVGDEQHIYRHWRKRRQIAASYAEFWLESDGQQTEDGLWVLPLKPRLRSREELKPSRRKAHERRYALLGELEARLSAVTRLLGSGIGGERAGWEAPLFEYGGSELSPGTLSLLLSAEFEPLPKSR